jgi:outer membrane protein, multidrug efflux system
MRLAPTLAIGAVLLGGCAVGPDYKRPDAAAPAGFRDQVASGEASLADRGWWDLYQDPVLASLVKEALEKGFDVQIAAARVEQARAAAAQIHGQRFPGVGYSGAGDRGKRTVLGSPSPLASAAASDGFDAYLGAAWEFDLWGRVRRLDEAARAAYLATEEGRRGVRLSLVSAVATTYFQLLELDEERAIAVNAQASFAESLRLFERRLEGGVSSRLETASAEAAQASAAARIPEVERQIAQTENQLCVLLGRAPGPIERESPLSRIYAVPEVPPGLPSALLERRPDVLAAEYAVQQANAGIGVTVGGFLPRIGLSAALGSVSQSLGNLTSGHAGLWSVGANVTGPLFQGGGLEGQYQQSKAAWEEAKLRYQQTALAAFADVSTTLVSRQKLVVEVTEREKAAAAYAEAVTLATKRYEAGKASYFEVLQAQQSLFPAQSALAQTRRDALSSVVQLYKALGGGWNLKDSEWNADGQGR